MKINLKSSTMVKPMEETPSGTQWLSSLDLLMPSSYHTRSIFYYRRHDAAANFFDAATLKAALSRALVEFYPYAGRLKKDCNGRMEIEFNGEGVQFVEAEADGEMDELGDFFAPNPEMIKLIPAVDYSRGISTFPLFLLQVTRFNCGGVSLGVANEHHISDGTSALHFINTWSDIARGVTTITTPPFFDRRLLSARNPPQLQFPHIEFQPPPPLKTPLQNSETTFSVFKLTRDHLNALKAKCNDDEGGKTPNYSTYEVITGQVWRCVCTARGLARDQETKLHIPVDGRHRLWPPLPQGYFGNVIFSASAVASGGEIVSNPLKFAVGKVHEAIALMDDEYLRSALDYLELCGDITAIARGPHTTKCPNLGITSWVRLPMYDADFGWGKPVYVGPGAAPFEGKSYLFPSPENDGSLFYAVTLIEEDMKKFEKLLYDI